MSSLFERIGGKEAVKAAVEIFYKKVLADERINKFFVGIEMDAQIRKQILFLTYAFGGPNNYNEKSMRDAHSKLVEKGLNDSHFDAVVENLGTTLKELGVPAELIQEAASIAETTRNDVLGK
jgi:hemoglobin